MPSKPQSNQPAHEREPASRTLIYEWYVVVLMGAYIVSFVDQQVITLLVQPIRRDRQTSDTEISLLMGFALFYFTMGLPLARLADTRSRRAIISAGILL